ncbi:MAG: VCBS repeat-containing protein [Planctomycetota bacterium]
MRRHRAIALPLVLGLVAGCTRHASVRPATAPRLAQVAFETRTEIFTGAERVADAVLEDLNGDGDLDLAVTALSGRLQVLLGRGDGTFSLAQSLDAAGFTFNVRAGDVDGDFDHDLVALRADTDMVTVYLNDGNATFTPGVDLPVPPGGDSAVLDDCDGDGALDIIVSHFFVDDLTAYFGNGDGTFDRVADIVLPPGTRAAGLIVSDADVDGSAELICADTAGDRVFVIAVDPGGAHKIEDEIPVGQFPVSVSVGDLTGDAVPDLVVSNADDQTVWVLERQGGTFVQTQAWPVDGTPGLNSIADATGDGVDDLIVNVFERAMVSIKPGVPGGGLGEERTVVASGLPYRPLVGDVNGDGRNDLLATGAGTEIVNLWLGRDGGWIGAVTHDPGVTRPEVVAATDMNGDGLAEIGVAGVDGTSLAILGVRDRATGVRGIETIALIDFGAPLVGVVTGDYDGDGDMDFAVNTRSGVKLLVNQSANGDLAFEAFPLDPTEVVLPGVGPFDVAAADMNGDGVIDMIATDAIAETVSVLRGNGQPLGFEAAPTVVPLPGVPGGLVVAEFTGDTALDAAVSRNAASMVSFLENPGDGVLERWLDVPVGAAPNYMRGADFDADGRMDVAVSNAAASEVTLILQSDTPGAFITQTVDTGETPTGLVAEDIDRDGQADLLVVSLQSGDTRVLIGTGDGGIGTRMRFPGTFGATSAAMADVDGDGLRDLIVASQEMERVSIYRNVSVEEEPAASAAIVVEP